MKGQEVESLKEKIKDVIRNIRKREDAKMQQETDLQELI